MLPYCHYYGNIWTVIILYNMVIIEYIYHINNIVTLPYCWYYGNIWAVTIFYNMVIIEYSYHINNTVTLTYWQCYGNSLTVNVLCNILIIDQLMTSKFKHLINMVYITTESIGYVFLLRELCPLVELTSLSK